MGPPGHRRVLPASLPGLDEHAREHGPLPRPGRGDDLIAAISAAGLTGRGGAGFPTARKLSAVARGNGSRRRPVVIANGGESEPASTKDITLLAHAPHLVLDGLQLAAEAVGAERAVAYVPATTAVRLTEQLAHRQAKGWDRIAVEVVIAPDTFIAGEESAVVAVVEGREPLPRDKRRLVVEAGVRGGPTLVQNVETLAHLALIARYGAAWFRSAGTPAEPGTMLVTVLGTVRQPGVLEVAIGTPVGRLLDLAGGVSAPPQALLLGGYFGAWVAADLALDRPFSSAGLVDLGAGPGAGLVAVQPAGACGLAETARVVRYLAGESAGQCGPCRFGLPAIAGQVERIADGRGADPGLLRRWLGQVDGRGGCAHPDGVVRLVRSALRTFGAEMEEHAGGRCSGMRTGVLPVPVGGSR
jgi:NADH:ubiquinone oxidoreductase subunit F (NADH-binding)